MLWKNEKLCIGDRFPAHNSERILKPRTTEPPRLFVFSLVGCETFAPRWRNTVSSPLNPGECSHPICTLRSGLQVQLQVQMQGHFSGRRVLLPLSSNELSTLLRSVSNHSRSHSSEPRPRFKSTCLEKCYIQLQGCFSTLYIHLLSLYPSPTHKMAQSLFTIPIAPLDGSKVSSGSAAGAAYADLRTIVCTSPAPLVYLLTFNVSSLRLPGRSFPTMF